MATLTRTPAPRRLSTRGGVTVDAIAAREEFTTGGALTASGALISDGGQLPEEHAARLIRDQRAAHSRGLRLYVVLSYSTPIGWYSPVTEEWYVPKVHYSVTTSRHQGVMRTGIATAGE